MNDRYVFRGVSEERTASTSREPLPEGDYPYIVADVGRPYEKNQKWVLKVQLIIDVPGKPWVWAYPWSGQTSSGEERDSIAEFLSSCNRTPQLDEEPDWHAVTGARGKVHLSIETAQMGKYAGQAVNKVDWFHFPHELAKQVSANKLPPAGPKPPVDPADDDLDLGREPKDIPFRSRIYSDVKRSRLSRRHVQ